MRLFMRVLVVSALFSGVCLVAGPASAETVRHGNDVSSLDLVLVDSADEVANWGEHVTFDVSTTASEFPYVDLRCYQSGVLVYAASAGFFPEYPWSQVFELRSYAWSGGAADCVATLEYSYHNRIRELMSIDFTVAA